MPTETTDATVLISRARELHIARKFTESRTAFRRLIDSQVDAHNTAEGFYGLAINEFSEGQLEAAKMYFLKSLCFERTNANCYYFLGEIAERRDSLAEAASYYKKATEIDVNHQGARAKLAALLPIEHVPGDQMSADPGTKKPSATISLQMLSWLFKSDSSEA